MSTASEKANLARIRDNQRRSRARRKEYLQELEARLRQCELQGIEASAEIQLAARRVADENKKLRGLLAQNGIGEDSVDAYLGSSPTTDGLMSGQYGASAGNAVQILEQLLQTRKTCCIDGNVPAQNTAPGHRSRDSSASVSTIQSPWDSVHPQNTDGRRLSMALPPSGKAASSAQQFMTPSTTTSRTSSVSATHNSNRGVPHHQRIAPIHQQMPRNPSPASNSSSRQSQMYDFNSGYSLHQHSPYDNNSPLGNAQKHLQPYTAPQRSSVYIPTTTGANVNSCNFATDMITTMAGADPANVRADLGCIPGMDCDVDNHQVFNLLDRYSGGVGL